jgi:hypothetical protein
VRSVLAALAALAVVALAPSAAGAQQLRLLELPGVEALPRVPPLAPPQPPPTETPPLRGTVFARERIRVGISSDGAPGSVTVTQELRVRSLGDYAFVVPAPASMVTPGAGSQSRPGLRPNQIVWQGFSPGRKLLVAVAELQPRQSTFALPVRVRVDGFPTSPGPFALTITFENATRSLATVAIAPGVQADVAAGFDALRAAAGINRPLEGQTVRLRREPTTRRFEVWAPLALRGRIAFPRGSVQNVTTTQFSRTLGRKAVRVTVGGKALRAVTPRLSVQARPLVAAALPQASETSLDALVLGSLRYARTWQFQRFLANPDPVGPSAATYEYETVAQAPTAQRESGSTDDDSGVPTALLIGGLVLLGVGLVVAWSHL